MNEDNWKPETESELEESTADTEKSPVPEAGESDAPAETSDKPDEEKPRRSLVAEARNWLRDLVVAAIICLLLIVYVAQPFRVEKTSMEPLLHDSDRILVSKISLLYEPIRRGDIVVLHNPRNPDESWIKRVIGLPGEEVRISEGIVYINGERLVENYIPPEKRVGRKNTYPPDTTAALAREYRYELSNFGIIVQDNPGHSRIPKVAQLVPEGYYFVLGDNRLYSMDSRDSVFTINDPEHPEEGGPGLIPARYIYGKALFRYWPLDKIGLIPSARYEGFSGGK